jgi:hypothetical protein
MGARLGRHHLHGKRIVRRRRRGCAPSTIRRRWLLPRKFLADCLDIFLDASQRSGGGRLEALNFVVDIFAIQREIVDHFDQFIGDHPAD